MTCPRGVKERHPPVQDMRRSAYADLLSVQRSRLISLVDADAYPPRA
jgi:hypothetical protein